MNARKEPLAILSMVSRIRSTGITLAMGQSISVHRLVSTNVDDSDVLPVSGTGAALPGLCIWDARIEVLVRYRPSQAAV